MGVAPVLQVTGFQNSGKTTVMRDLIQAGASNQLMVGTIKHHGHGGVPDLPSSSKDSDQHFQSGADISAVEGEGAIHIVSRPGFMRLSNLLDFYKKMPLDVILIEGYKKESYPKLVLIRQKEELPLLNQVSNLAAVVSDLSIETNVPVFLFNEKERLIQWFLAWVKEC